MRQVRLLAVGPTVRTDGELLRAFSTRSDQEAFAALAKRHGALVFSVCRRVLHQVQDAEDAFQATFIVLARQADSLSRRGSLSAGFIGLPITSL
jgi:RNA polymerase sigma-70 factor (ECF subfamily)